MQCDIGLRAFHRFVFKFNKLKVGSEILKIASWDKKEFDIENAEVPAQRFVLINRF